MQRANAMSNQISFYCNFVYTVKSGLFESVMIQMTFAVFPASNKTSQTFQTNLNQESPQRSATNPFSLLRS